MSLSQRPARSRCRSARTALSALSTASTRQHMYVVQQQESLVDATKTRTRCRDRRSCSIYIIDEGRGIEYVVVLTSSGTTCRHAACRLSILHNCSLQPKNCVQILLGIDVCHRSEFRFLGDLKLPPPFSPDSRQICRSRLYEEVRLASCDA